MSEKTEITFMQTRLIRLASEEWHLPVEQIIHLFKEADVLGYIEKCYGIFHCEGDEAVLEDITEFLQGKGIELKDGFVLYHGSYCEVKEPELAKCAKRKDFGQGFYLTTSKEQAESFLRTSIAKAIATGTIEEGQKFGYISTFEFKLSENLETHIFENADVDWLHCIAAHRKKKMFIEVEREMARYDIIAGKIADDATNATLTAYLAGAFGTAGDKEADDFCIRQLLPNKLKDQYCFKTEAAIKCLKFVKGEKIWLK
jgi:hypothetical protein